MSPSTLISYLQILEKSHSEDMPNGVLKLLQALIAAPLTPEGRNSARFEHQGSQIDSTFASTTQKAEESLSPDKPTIQYL